MNPEIPQFNPNDIEGSVPQINGRIVDTVNLIDFDEPGEDGLSREDITSRQYGPRGANWDTVEVDPDKMTENEKQEFLLGRKLVHIVVTEAGDEFADQG